MFRFNSSKGFTLIEMCIVLVIIGIIMATIIKGGAVLRASRIKGLIQTQNDLHQAALFYYEKYGSSQVLSMTKLQAANMITGTTDPLPCSNFGCSIAFGNYSFVSPTGGKVWIPAVKYIDMPYDVAQALEVAIDGADQQDAHKGSVQAPYGTNTDYMTYSSNLYTVFCALYPVTP
jgi:prepilin-type N-terminal cleavage/methylation domain-containing protein